MVCRRPFFVSLVKMDAVLAKKYCYIVVEMLGNMFLT